ncbi:aspartic proteinase NANA, chloroplast [Aegilops tauschii subsp. strangulata]|uniref:Peptidase A1 domain-containing protein n=2 Tax=Aegilops tauschii subsp. strangulata TaxID=200361 RepID=A0A453FDC1_AEGTS|nr:aspartic proteinase NANA, chloroplast [Aegilops tauschii subsp. strangulata]
MAGRRLALLLVAVAAAFLAGASGRRASDSARFPLLRLAAPASLADLARSDRQRMAFIASHGRRRTRETAAGSSASSAAAAFAMPLTSGAYTGIGQYFVRFRVGTPAQPFLLVADTGSDLTWVKCRRPASASAPANSSLSPADSGSGRAFRPEDSRTWAPISCASDTCTKSLPFSLATCPTPGSPCAYDYRYKDGSAARGTVGTESATIALSGREERKAKLKGLVLGCTSSYTGPSFEASDGVLSLGYSGISFASHAASRFGGRFSYCLVDHLSPRNATSYLTFGPNPAVSSSHASPSSCNAAAAPRARTTPLLLDRRMRPFYDVSLKAISVAGEFLKIPRAVWDVEAGGGVILDSGTSLTVLAKPAYRAVVAALSKELAGLPRVTMDPFEYCYNWTSPSGEDADVAVPKMAVHFAGAARLEPPGKSYVIDAAPGVKCIGLQEGPWPGISVIGNILQQEHLWEFDIKNRRLRFQRSRCTH